MNLWNCNEKDSWIYHKRKMAVGEINNNNNHPKPSTRAASGSCHGNWNEATLMQPTSGNQRARRKSHYVRYCERGFCYRHIHFVNWLTYNFGRSPSIPCSAGASVGPRARRGALSRLGSWPSLHAAPPPYRSEQAAARSRATTTLHFHTAIHNRPRFTLKSFSTHSQTFVQFSIYFALNSVFSQTRVQWYEISTLHRVYTLLQAVLPTRRH